MDNGLGIPPETSEIIKEFFNSRSEKSSGTGVGLYLIREAVSKMGGKIQVSSIFKDHTKFILEIPNKA
jgi:signal transduction histidine kinase